MSKPFVRVKELFFDRPAVVAATDPATRRALSKAGAFIRRDARSNTRKAKKTSQPGESPRGKTGLLRKNIFFSYDPASRSVLVGPARLNGTDGEVPRLLEEGGEVERRFFLIAEDGGPAETDAGTRRRNRNARGRFTNVRVRSSRKAKPRRVRYEPRPYMQPAFAKTLPRVPEFFRDSVRRA